MYPELFSSCSQQQLSRFLEEVNPACLLDTPSTNRIYGGPVCGNAFLEPGEECDCGTVEVCVSFTQQEYIRHNQIPQIKLIRNILLLRNARIPAAMQPPAS